MKRTNIYLWIEYRKTWGFFCFFSIYRYQIIRQEQLLSQKQQQKPTSYFHFYTTNRDRQITFQNDTRNAFYLFICILLTFRKPFVVGRMNFENVRCQMLDVKYYCFEVTPGIVGFNVFSIRYLAIYYNLITINSIEIKTNKKVNFLNLNFTHKSPWWYIVECPLDLQMFLRWIIITMTLRRLLEVLHNNSIGLPQVLDFDFVNENYIVFHW